MMTEFRRGTRAALVLFFLAAAGAGSACGGTVTLASSGGSGTGGSEGSSGSSGNGGSGGAGCPAGVPESGSPCPVNGQMCEYASFPMGANTTADCSGGVWTVFSCEGIGPLCVCPTELPTAGTACNPCCGQQQCSYTAGGECGPSAQCSPSGTWSISVPPCLPPTACSVSTTADACSSAGACRWLVPGCSTTGFTAGCFDAANCTPGTGCADGQSCVTVDTDPCWDSICDVCAGGKADICTGPG